MNEPTLTVSNVTHAAIFCIFLGANLIEKYVREIAHRTVEIKATVFINGDINDIFSAQNTKNIIINTLTPKKYLATLLVFSGCVFALARTMVGNDKVIIAEKICDAINTIRNVCIFSLGV